MEKEIYNEDMIKVVWQSSVDTSSISDRAQVVVVDGDVVLEVLTANVGFWDRLKLGIKWIFTSKPFVFTRQLLDEDFRKIGVAYGEKNCQG